MPRYSGPRNVSQTSTAVYYLAFIWWLQSRGGRDSPGSDETLHTALSQTTASPSFVEGENATTIGDM